MGRVEKEVSSQNLENGAAQTQGQKNTAQGGEMLSLQWYRPPGSPWHQLPWYSQPLRSLGLSLVPFIVVEHLMPGSYQALAPIRSEGPRS